MKHNRRWCVMDLIVDHQTGKLRETALWSNVGKACMTWAFCYVVYKGGSSEALWLAYGSIVVIHEAAARFFNQKQQAIDNNAAPMTTTSVTATQITTAKEDKSNI